ncbi:nicotinate phosphoribosyltransferase [Pilobolus umbonatus]|nr:nicotinate phosphoribosyltransferase [Pilobolus umbonatus]
MAATQSAIRSLLDNDIYKFTMQNAIMKYYHKDIPVVYQFTNRNEAMQLNVEAVEWLHVQIKELGNLTLSSEERQYLSTYSYWDNAYLDYLSHFRYKPEEQVKTSFDKKTRRFELEVVGSWHETILYEVPLLSLISEAYFRFVDRDWNYDGQVEQASEKARRLFEHGVTFSEFGTRRRRDFKTHDLVMGAICKAYEEYKAKCQKEHREPKGVVAGTSNVYLAKKYKVNAIGTIAHEFFMGVSALEGLANVNKKALEIWHQIYHGALGIALTDTYTTSVFLKDFDHQLASMYAGVRQDSGNPFEFITLIVNHYKSIGIDPSTRTLVFSDSLDVDLVLRLYDAAVKAGIKPTFGIGTSFTNDFHKADDESVKSKPMNMVIKLRECVGKPIVKLSDDPLKHSKDTTTLEAVQHQLGIKD